MAQNNSNGNGTGARFSISRETETRIELLRGANQLFNDTYESIRSGLPKRGVSDNTDRADDIFSKYFGEAQRITRAAYQQYMSDNIGDALLDGNSTEI